MKRRTFLQATLATVALAVSAASLTVRTAVADICAKVRRRQRNMILPPLPKWNKTTDDIDYADFFRRSLDYERSLLPANLVFPREGQIWEAVRDCEVHVLKCMTGPKAPLFWPNAALRKGELVRILALDHPKPLQVRFQPIRSQELHENTAPKDLRYELCLRMACTVPVSGQSIGYFNELFRLIEDVREAV
jgi:hypothetical protein